MPYGNRERQRAANAEHMRRKRAVAVEPSRGTLRPLVDEQTMLATAFFTVDFVRSRDELAYTRYRQRVGKAILLGLEFLVAADIIRTVAVSPSFRGVGVLAIIVVVRTFLSFTLEVELEGKLPWQRRSPKRDAHA